MASDYLFDFSSKIAVEDIDGIKNQLNIPLIEESLMSNVLNSMWSHPFAYKLLVGLGCIFLFVMLYFLRSCYNICKVKDIRNESDDDTISRPPSPLSFSNYLWALVYHDKGGSHSK